MKKPQSPDPLNAPPSPAEKPAQEAVRQVTAPGRVRRYRAWLFQGYILTSLLAFAALAIFVSVFPVDRFDVAITRALQDDMPGWGASLLIGVSFFGFAVQSVVTALVTLVVLYFLGLRWEAVIALLAGFGSGLVNTLIKTAIRRPRPTSNLVEVIQQLNSYGFPSGHVMFYVAFFGFLAFLAYTLLKHGWLRSVLLVIFIGLIVLVGPSRIYMGEHWASDVIAAYLVGFLLLFGVIYLYRWGKVRFSQRQPVAPGVEEGPLPKTVVPIPNTGEEKHEKRVAEKELAEQKQADQVKEAVKKEEKSDNP